MSSMINPDRFSELCAELGADCVGEMIALFREETTSALSRIGRATTAVEAADQLHMIRGMAANVGADALAVICREAEQSLADGKPDIAIDELQNAFAQAERGLETLYSGMGKPV